MQKKIFTLLLLLLLSSCGYEATHSKKSALNYDFSISQLSFFGNREVNLKIKEKLNNYTLNKKGKIFALKISTTSQKIILVKDTTGDATTFQSTIIVNVDVLTNNKFKTTFTIKEKFNYNSISNKFDLKKYEKEIKNSLAETATDKLILRLSNI
tara:strand:+ start:117 stop:578 length:462 start_codon:yes stop_codon:yes gene_type:complete